WEIGREGILVPVLVFLAVVLAVGFIYRADTKQLGWGWKLWLVGLRVLVIAALLVVALDLQIRTETRITRPSRLDVLVDTSLSMSFPDKSAAGESAPGSASRSQAVENLLADSPLLRDLRQTHEVRIFTFDSKLTSHDLLPRFGSAQVSLDKPTAPVIPSTQTELPTAMNVALAGGALAVLLAAAGGVLMLRRVQAASVLVVAGCLVGIGVGALAFWVNDQHEQYALKLKEWEQSRQQKPEKTAVAQEDTTKAGPNWHEILAPRGLETRMGESVTEALRDTAGETLSGLLVIGDGGNNAGYDVTTAHDKALATKPPMRIVTLGVGSPERPINLQIATVQAPTHVHKGDGFAITAYVQGQGLIGNPIQVELLSKLDGEEGQPTVIESKEVSLLEDGIPVAVSFDYQPTEAGKRMFNIRAKPTRAVRELTTVDNEKALPPVDITERKTKVLIVAGGPMRDYQFVRNLLHRDAGIEVDVWLQTGGPGISQEAHKLLAEFPSAREELFEYDVVIAFDPNWRLIAPESRDMLAEWVFQQAGGLILVAGEVDTPDIPSVNEGMKTVQALYPVVLRPTLEFEFKHEYLQPWPIEFTREGAEAEFLQLTADPASSAQVWKEFTGMYRCYPTAGPKAGATVYAYLSDPQSADEYGKPIVIAEQFYGAGRSVYLGCAEFWRLRAMGENYYDQLWIKLVREAGQGRLLRGTNRGVLLLERSTYPLGSTVQVRAKILDPQFHDYTGDHVTLEVYDPSGRPFVPAIRLDADKTRPGQFQGAFPANLPGRYRLELPIPESKDVVPGYVQVELPNLEFDHPEQDVGVLQRLATTELGGKYLTLSEADQIPALFPDRSTTKSQFDVPRSVWDMQWVMYLLVAILGLEWLTRKLLKLA
ncbi:MAG TPA: hypothetical protein VHB77_17590, partial [Planctomycetaceae bacterium]|nr:hypothetical protein [Planctomycetaceae bacterium]